MIIVDEYAQGTPEWFAATAGSIGGGTIGAVATGGEGKVRLKALRDKAAEIVSAQRKEGQRIWQYERGLKYEAEARDYFEMVYGVEVRQVAFVRPDDGAILRHFSPDGLFDDDKKYIEIKVREPAVFVEFFFERKMAINEQRQVQWGHRIMNTEMCYHINYCPEIAKAGIISPMIVTEIAPDIEKINNLDILAECFIGDMLSIVRKLKGG